jgi:hypothetical protein
MKHFIMYYPSSLVPSPSLYLDIFINTLSLDLLKAMFFPELKRKFVFHYRIEHIEHGYLFI